MRSVVNSLFPYLSVACLQCQGREVSGNECTFLNCASSIKATRIQDVAGDSLEPRHRHDEVVFQ